MMMMMNAVSATPTGATGGGGTTTPTPTSNTQGQSTLGYGPSYGYNPYPSPYPTGLPGSSITGMNAYGSGGYGAGYGGGGFAGGYGSGYGNTMGNPYGGYQNNTGTGGLSPQTGLANGYGFDRAVAPTVFQGALSGDGTLPSVHPGRASQESFAKENAGHQANKLGLLAGFGTMGILSGLSAVFRPLQGVPQLLFALGAATTVGLATKLNTQTSLEEINKQKYVALDYADNGSLDGSYLVQRNYETESKLFGFL